MSRIEPVLSIDLTGTYELLDRLQLALEIRRSDELAPSLPPINEIQFATELNGVNYARLEDGSLWLHDTQRGAVAHLITQSSQLDLWYDDRHLNGRYFWHSFVRSAVAFYLSDRHYTPLHAAALVDPIGKLWLFCGYTHTGKSTLTIGLLEIGWGYLGDDGVVLAESETGIIAHSWWGSSLLDPILATTYPHLDQHLGEWIGNRRSIDLRECYRYQWCDRQMPVRLVFPTLDPTEPLARLSTLKPGLALAQLMQHAATCLLEDPQPHLLRLQALCLQSDCSMLYLGLAARTQPHTVAKTLTELTLI
jgi:hypothetical protein